MVGSEPTRFSSWRASGVLARWGPATRRGFRHALAGSGALGGLACAGGLVRAGGLWRMLGLWRA